MKKLLATLVIASAALISAPAQAVGETLVVDGATYQSYKQSGLTYHWETPDVNPMAAYFPLRDQTWAGNGSEHLPCKYGIHWISNKNVLTVSHCLEGETTTTTTTPQTTTTTVATTTSTTVPTESTSTTSLVPATTTSVPPSSSVPTTTAPEVTTTSSVIPTTTVSPVDPTTTTVSVAVTTPPVPTTTQPDPGTVELPKTGRSLTKAGIASTLVALGAILLAASRRKEEECSI